MLSGIKVGKRKRSAPSSGSNQSAAEVLRASLLSSSSPGQCTTFSSSNVDDDAAIRALYDRGRISNDVPNRSSSSNDDEIIVINRSNTDSSTISNSNIQRETELGVRYNSRGKLSRHSHEQSRNKTDFEMTITEMASQEKSCSSNNTSNNMDDIYATNIMKLGHKGYKKLNKMMGGNHSHSSGADEEDYLQESSTYTNLYRSNDDKLSPAELAKRSTSRQIVHHDAITNWTARSTWWMESPNFDKRYLLALGEKISLVMTPSHKRLQQEEEQKKGGLTTSSSSSWVGGGGQCMIVPIAYCESFVSLDEDAWDEVKRFQLSLCHMFHSQGRGVIFLETVHLTSQSASGGVGGGMTTQARMDVIPVPLAVERDAQLYFRSALAEVAQEWGTHQRPIALEEVGLRGGKKTLRNSVPRRGFPYFYCGWGEGSVNNNNNCESTVGGYVQLIENEDGKRFQKDFGLDVIAGMMGCDPIRFQRKSPSLDGDRGAILQFCDSWKKFDWTLELDG
jgi:hypothetical protein